MRVQRRPGYFVTPRAARVIRRGTWGGGGGGEVQKIEEIYATTRISPSGRGFLWKNPLAIPFRANAPARNVLECLATDSDALWVFPKKEKPRCARFFTRRCGYRLFLVLGKSIFELPCLQLMPRHERVSFASEQRLFNKRRADEK